MPSRPGDIKVGDVVQMDPGVHERFAGVLFIVAETTPVSLRMYYLVPGATQQHPLRGEYETSYKAVTLIGAAAWTARAEIFLCPSCTVRVPVNRANTCKHCRTLCLCPGCLPKHERVCTHA